RRAHARIPPPGRRTRQAGRGRERGDRHRRRGGAARETGRRLSGGTPVHIALFTDFHPATLGGVQTAMRALTSGLRGLGHRVTVFCPPAPHPVADDPDLVLLRPVPRATLAGGLPMVLPTRANRYAVDAAFATRARV